MYSKDSLRISTSKRRTNKTTFPNFHSWIYIQKSRIKATRFFTARVIFLDRFRIERFEILATSQEHVSDSGTGKRARSVVGRLVEADRFAASWPSFREPLSLSSGAVRNLPERDDLSVENRVGRADGNNSPIDRWNYRVTGALPKGNTIRDDINNAAIGTRGGQFRRHSSGAIVPWINNL